MFSKTCFSTVKTCLLFNHKWILRVITKTCFVYYEKRAFYIFNMFLCYKTKQKQKNKKQKLGSFMLLQTYLLRYQKRAFSVIENVSFYVFLEPCTYKIQQTKRTEDVCVGGGGGLFDRFLRRNKGHNSSAGIKTPAAAIKLQRYIFSFAF